MSEIQLLNQIRSVEEEAFASVDSCSSIEELEGAWDKYLGKSGSLVALSRKISGIEDLEERKQVGTLLNSLRSGLKNTLQDKRSVLLNIEKSQRLAQEGIDVTLPARPVIFGKLHPVTHVISEVKSVLSGLGLSLVYGPDIEDEFHVFDALNTPMHHPARDKNDTFYLEHSENGKRLMLRTHTSSVQVRVMEKNPSYPIKVFSIGKVYRNDWDNTHSPMFHQAEGLYVDKNVNMGHLKYCINRFLHEFFGSAVESRMRANFFPFTEPSLEVDVKNEHGEWMEILGCGMVHPKVLSNVNIDCDQYSGFAFGMGIERIAMLKYGISDLRNLYANRLEWLSHYGFCLGEILGNGVR